MLKYHGFLKEPRQKWKIWNWFCTKRNGLEPDRNSLEPNKYFRTR